MKLTDAKNAIDAYEALAGKLGTAVEARKNLAAKLPPGSMDGLVDAFPEDGADLAAFAAAMEAVPDVDKVIAAFPDPKDLVTLVSATLKGNAKLLGTLADSERGGSPAKLKDLAATFKDDPAPLHAMLDEAGLGARPEAAAALFNEGCEGAPARLKALCAAYATPAERAELKGLLEDGGLGAAPGTLGPLLATGCGGEPAALKQFGASFKEKDARDGLKRMLTAGGLAGQKNQPGEGDIDPGCLAQLLKNGAGPKPDGFAGDDAKRRADAIAAMFKGTDEAGAKQLKAVMSDGGLGKAPEALGHLVGGVGSAGAGGLGKLTAAFGTKDRQDGLKALLTVGGLAAEKNKDGGYDIEPDCLAQLLAHGSGSPPTGFAGDETERRAEGLAKLCAGLTAPGDLAGLLKGGGLGKKPEVFARLVGVGCDGDPATVSAFATGLKGKEAQIKGLVEEGGLAVPPTLLAQLVKDGRTAADAGLVASMAKLTPPQVPDAAARAKAGTDGAVGELGRIGTAFGTTAERKDLAAMLGNGGLGRKPAVFGQLFRLGCDGDGDKLKRLTTGFPAGNAADLANLASVVGAGGLDTDPSLLAHLVKDGCDGDPAALKRFTTGFGAAPKAAKLKELVTTGGIATKPEILGHLVKTGCDGDPAKVEKLHTEFSGKLGKLQGLITQGGLATKPDTLAKVLADGAGKDPAKLKKLQEAFDGAGDLDKLKHMMEAWEDTDAGANGQPGKSIATLMDAKHLHTTNFNTLKTTFYAGIDGKAADPARRKAMLAAAPTFVIAACPAPGALPQPGNPELAHAGAKTTRMEHFLKRHTRKFYKMANSNHADENSFFPEGTTETDVKDILADVLTSIGATPTLAPPAAGGKSKYVPLPARGMWVQIGVKKMPPPAPADALGVVAGDKYVDQLFPIALDKARQHFQAANNIAYFNTTTDPVNGWSKATREIESFTKEEMKGIRAAIC